MFEKETHIAQIKMLQTAILCLFYAFFFSNTAQVPYKIQYIKPTLSIFEHTLFL